MQCIPSLANSAIVGNAIGIKTGTVNGIPYHINTNISEELINYNITGLKPYNNYMITLYKDDPLNDIQDQLYICK